MSHHNRFDITDPQTMITFLLAWILGMCIAVQHEYFQALFDPWLEPSIIPLFVQALLILAILSLFYATIEWYFKQLESMPESKRAKHLLRASILHWMFAFPCSFINEAFWLLFVLAFIEFLGFVFYMKTCRLCSRWLRNNAIEYKGRNYCQSCLDQLHEDFGQVIK